MGYADVKMTSDPAPSIALVSVSGLVTSPTKMPSDSSHFVQPNSSFALVALRTSARTGTLRLFSSLYVSKPVFPVAPLTTTGEDRENATRLEQTSKCNNAIGQLF